MLWRLLEALLGSVHDIETNMPIFCQCYYFSLHALKALRDYFFLGTHVLCSPTSTISIRVMGGVKL